MKVGQWQCRGSRDESGEGRAMPALGKGQWQHREGEWIDLQRCGRRKKKERKEKLK